MTNTKWSRWIKASIAKYFDDNKAGNALHIVPSKKPTDQDVDLFELRIDGPKYIQSVKNFYLVTVELNMLVSTKVGSNHYSHEDRVGLIANLFKETITVNKYNDAPSELLGCLNRKDEIIITNFHLVRPNNRVQASTVESTYSMTLEV